MNTRTNEMYEIVDGQPMDAVIRVIGVGGGGCNSVNEMVMAEIEGVELIAANTDRRHLEKCKTTNILQLGPRSSRGLGAGSDPARGREAAMESKDLIREMIEGTDLLFITAGMGGGTGTGAAPVIAEIAKELGILTVAVVTKPYAFEPVKRRHVAERGLQELRNLVDSLIVIPNEKLQLVLPEDMTVVECHKKADEVLKNAVQGISGIITSPGEISVDFADVRTVMSNRGMAMMGIGVGNGENRAIAAVESALSCPLIDDIELHDAKGILVTPHSQRLAEEEGADPGDGTGQRNRQRRRRHEVRHLDRRVAWRRPARHGGRHRPGLQARRVRREDDPAGAEGGLDQQSADRAGDSAAHRPDQDRLREASLRAPAEEGGERRQRSGLAQLAG
jgi:cell division protein FtsZ